ncbi:GDP-mannose pyrophosphatase NudK [Chitinimonas sp. PSY-7]|uniref:GDP-mannose pyrophosphatase NudK n=1 Tax=Chitinimonas sp. PSY-7 TaxID=3459088 RepID=UPI00403FDFC1
MKQVELLESHFLSDNWYLLHKHIYSRQQSDGKVVTQTREVYDRGNGAAILLYNRQRGTVVLTRQFRLPTFLNGNPDGLLIEACAGLLDNDAPEDCIRREVMEETGYQVGAVQKVFEAYMSPGSVTEILHFFVAEYDHAGKVGAGGGVPHEGEDIEVLEMPFVQALAAIRSGEIRDGKTIMLLQYAQIHGLLPERA